MTTIVAISAQNAALDTYQITQVSLHSDNPSTTGANELASADYVRQNFTFAAADNGRRYGVSNATFDLKIGDVVAWAAYWNGGTFVLAKQLTAPISFNQDGQCVLKAADTYLD